MFCAIYEIETLYPCLHLWTNCYILCVTLIVLIRVPIHGGIFLAYCCCHLTTEACITVHTYLVICVLGLQSIWYRSFCTSFSHPVQALLCHWVLCGWLQDFVVIEHIYCTQCATRDAIVCQDTIRTLRKPGVSTECQSSIYIILTLDEQDFKHTRV